MHQQQLPGIHARRLQHLPRLRYTVAPDDTNMESTSGHEEEDRGTAYVQRRSIVSCPTNTEPVRTSTN